MRSDVRTVIACVDSFEQELARGALYSYDFGKAVDFESIDQMLFGMEELLADEKEEASVIDARDIKIRIGKLLNLYIEVLHRQNFTIQGTLRWSGYKEKFVFRSEMELIRQIKTVLMQRV